MWNLIAGSFTNSVLFRSFVIRYCTMKLLALRLFTTLWVMPNLAPTSRSESPSKKIACISSCSLSDSKGRAAFSLSTMTALTTVSAMSTASSVIKSRGFPSLSVNPSRDKILPQIEDWQNRPLDVVYPILYIDAILYSIRDNGVIRKLAAYVILGINTEGKKEVLTISVGDNESAKYRLSVMNELKNRSEKNVLVICADGLTGIKKAIAAAFPKTEYQCCIVHQVKNTLKYVPDKDRKTFDTDLKTIYQASDEKSPGSLRPCNRKMGTEISEFHETLER